MKEKCEFQTKHGIFIDWHEIDSKHAHEFRWSLHKLYMKRDGEKKNMSLMQLLNAKTGARSSLAVISAAVVAVVAAGGGTKPEVKKTCFINPLNLCDK